MIADAGPVTDGLLDWIARPDPRPRVMFATDDGWDVWSYPELAGAALAHARRLRHDGLCPGDRVALVQPGGPAFVAAFFGTFLAGGQVVPLPSPALGEDPGAWADGIRRRLGSIRPVTVLSAPEIAARLTTVCGATPGVTVRPLLPPTRAAAASMPAPAARSTLIQFTSGSSGAPRAVRLPAGALAANGAAIADWLGMGASDSVATWLPVHHDMGLVGCLVAPIMRQVTLRLLSPRQFLRDPLRFLGLFGAHGATLTAMPPLGLEHVLRRIRPADLAGLDFTGWRALIVGAQRVPGPVLRAFTELLAPHGFAPGTVLPAYGLAEATLAVTATPLSEPWTDDTLADGPLTVGAPVPAGAGSRTVVSCGRPLRGVTVTVAGPDGRPLPDRHLGEILVDGPSVMTGYAHPGGTAHTCDRPLRTGDLGYLDDGRLFVLGRHGDSVKVRGRTVFAEDLEMALQSHGLVPTRMTVLLGVAPEGPVAVLVAERGAGDLDGARSVLRRLADEAEPRVYAVPPGTIPRTTSGKPRRRQLWQQFLAGRLPGTHAEAEDERRDPDD